MDSGKSENEISKNLGAGKIARIMLCLFGVFVALFAFGVLDKVTFYIVHTAGGIALLAMGINISDATTAENHSEAINNLEAIAEILGFIGGAMGAVKAYKWIAQTAEEKAANKEKVSKEQKEWNIFVALLVGAVWFGGTFFIFLVSTFLLSLFGINAWADFAEHNIKLFNVMAGIVGGIAGAAGGFRSYKKRAKKNAIS